MINILISISRILVGSLFIVSGLIKANDTLGFSYKLIEYFEPEVLNLEFLIPIALPLSAFICLFEIVLGAMVLFGTKMKWASWLLLLMIIFFTFLTFYSAYFNKVTDCGCFGDAIKLTPWQSFTKDVVLLFFVGILFIFRNKIEPNTLKKDQILLPISGVLIALFGVLMLGWPFVILFFIIMLAVIFALKKLPNEKVAENASMIGSIFVSLVFVIYTLTYLPVKDFRPYAEGKSLIEGMKSAEELGKEAPIFATNYLLKNKSTGEEKEYSSVEYMQNEMWNEWEYVDAIGDPYKVKDGYEPPIHDFNLFDADGYDLTQEILANDKALLVVAYDLAKCNEDQVKANIEVFNELSSKGVKCYFLTASVEDEVSAIIKNTGLNIPVLSADAITLKTIVRANPGFVYLENGVVKKKWSGNVSKSASDILANS